MRCHDNDVGSPIVEQGFGRLHDGASGVDHVVDDDADPIPHIADNLEHPHLIGDVRIASLVDDGEGGAEDICPALGDPNPAGIW